jgi:hypothetical protein
LAGLCKKNKPPFVVYIVYTLISIFGLANTL